MAGKLKPLEVERQITPGKYPDGDGLYLVVAGPTSCKERWHGLGSLQDVSLKEARIKRHRAAASALRRRHRPGKAGSPGRIEGH
jgi:hypothetical protein